MLWQTKTKSRHTKTNTISIFAHPHASGLECFTCVGLRRLCIFTNFYSPFIFGIFSIRSILETRTRKNDKRCFLYLKCFFRLFIDCLTNKRWTIRIKFKVNRDGEREWDSWNLTHFSQNSFNTSLFTVVDMRAWIIVSTSHSFSHPEKYMKPGNFSSHYKFVGTEICERKFKRKIIAHINGI